MGVRKAVARQTWCWQRWIASSQQEEWIERLQALRCTTWTLTERPNRARALLAVHGKTKTEAVSLNSQFGGQVQAVKTSEWLSTRPTPPTRIGRRLEILHENSVKRKTPAFPRLCIPHGVAFGSGEHATTYMLLRELSRSADYSRMSVLDLGTGSGVLALAARLFGARKIVATDFDPDAVRTAAQNEALNFSEQLIRWRRADVKKLRASVQYDLVLANLFSGILCEAAPQIAASVAPTGQLWLSGILVTQQQEVIAAYRRQGMKLIRAFRRGKWVMLKLCV